MTDRDLTAYERAHLDDIDKWTYGDTEGVDSADVCGHWHVVHYRDDTADEYDYLECQYCGRMWSDTAEADADNVDHRAVTEQDTMPTDCVSLPAHIVAIGAVLAAIALGVWIGVYYR